MREGESGGWRMEGGGKGGVRVQPMWHANNMSLSAAQLPVLPLLAQTSHAFICISPFAPFYLMSGAGAGPRNPGRFLARLIRQQLERKMREND